MLNGSGRGRNLYRERIQIPVKELREGMFVAALDIPWDNSPFLVKGFAIENEQTLEQLKSLCHYVYIDVVKSKLAGLQPVPVAIEASDDSLETAVEKCKPIYEQSVELLASLFQSMHLDSQSIEQAKAYVNDYADTVKENPSVLRWLSLAGSHSSQLIDHTLNVTILSMMLGTEAGLNREELHELGMAALLHDIGMMQIPKTILNKEDELSHEEMNLIQQHPQFAGDLLQQDETISDTIKEAIAKHHERLDGQGYPEGLGAYDIPLFSKIIAIADTYDGQISHRSYHSASSSLDGLKTLMALRDTHYDDALVIKFIKIIGVYPVGSIVEITDGRVGIVLPTLKGDKMRPDVAIVMDTDNNPITPYTLKLGDELDLKISKVLPDGVNGIFFKDYADSIL
jgi:HD-GYP domain-containing protein (c-di-GMP phosphodiesterase class II)